MSKLGVVMFSRLRKDAALYDLPGPRKTGQRGRPRSYGKNRISLVKRAPTSQRLGSDQLSMPWLASDSTT